MTAPYLRLENAEGQRIEVGPFTEVTLSVNGHSVPAAKLSAAGWHILDGAELGDSGLTGEWFDIIWGQAKVAS